MICPKCTTEFEEVTSDERCRMCGACVNPWSPQLAVAAFDATLVAEAVLISLKSVPDWKTQIAAQIPSAASNPHIATLTDAYAERLLQWTYNNPPTPVTSLFAIPSDNNMWRVERPLEQRFINSVES